jgi:hypothetical protein
MPSQRAARRFSWKPFTSFIVTLAFVVIALSGAVLYVAPSGRVANWSHWTLAAADKAAWQALHTVFATMFLIAAAFHLYFNWNVLLAYLRSKASAGMRMKRELSAASALTAGIFVMTLAGLPPFSTVMEVGETAKNSWAAPEDEPPVPHAEELTLAKFGEAAHLPVDRLVANLSQAGIAAGVDDVIGDIADRSGLAPMDLFVKMRGELEAPAQAIVEGGGYGRKTVEQVAAQLRVPLDQGLARLASLGVQARPADNLRALADSSGRSAIDLVKAMAGEGR